MPEEKYEVRYYNRFNFSDEEVIVPGPLTKEQAEKIASDLQSSHSGLGGRVYEAVRQSR